MPVGIQSSKPEGPVMKTRFLFAVAIVGGISAVALFAPRTSAQDLREKGLLMTLAVGQMVELRNDETMGLIITTYDDPALKAKMNARIIELGTDYIALEGQIINESQTEMRYPLHTIAAISHVHKRVGAKAAPKKKDG
jgi:hypothetical protein